MAAFGTKTLENRRAHHKLLPLEELRKAIDNQRTEIRGVKKSRGGGEDGVEWKRGRDSLSGGWTGGGVDQLLGIPVLFTDGSELRVNVKNNKKDIMIEYTEDNVRWLVDRIRAIDGDTGFERPLVREEEQRPNLETIEPGIGYDMIRKLVRVWKPLPDGSRRFRTIAVLQSRSYTPAQFQAWKTAALDEARAWLRDQAQTPPKRSRRHTPSRSTSSGGLAASPIGQVSSLPAPVDGQGCSYSLDDL
jgi:hypothetical protein